MLIRADLRRQVSFTVAVFDMYIPEFAGECPAVCIALGNTVPTQLATASSIAANFVGKNSFAVSERQAIDA